MKKQSGMNDFDNIFVTVALWVSMAALFAVSLTLPVLPDRVTIFYKPNDLSAEYYSKYSNILDVIFSVIPAGIIIIAAVLRSRNRMQRNFQSVLLFCIMISICFGGVTMYGVTKQFTADYELNSVNVHTVIVLAVSVILSVMYATTPMMLHTPANIARSKNIGPRRRARCEVFETYWGVGAFGFLAVGVVSSFFPGMFAYIPLGVYVAAHTVFLIIMTSRFLKRGESAQKQEEEQEVQA